MAGLMCGTLLAKEGLDVCVLERDQQLGGCLQTFAFHKKVFDSCVHYIGGLGEGHTLNKIFRYCGIMDALRLEPLDDMGYDEIIFKDEPLAYPLAGRKHFVEALVKYFPDERDSLERYVRLIDDTAAAFPLYNLRKGEASEKGQYAEMELQATLDTITTNKRLQEVLAGNNFLYAGLPGITPWYVHGLIAHSYMHSVHKVLPGSSEISKALGRVIRAHGGTVLRNAEVTALNEEDGLIVSATANGETYAGKHFISAIHPQKTLEITQSKVLRPAYRKRIESRVQSPTVAMLNIVLKPGVIRSHRRNIYWHPDGAVYKQGEHWPGSVAFFFNDDPQHPGFAETVSVIVYDYYSNYADWEASVSRAGLKADRPEAYGQYKEETAQKMLQSAYRLLPELERAIEAYTVASPLTFRDYTATPEGSLYGLMKDINLPQGGNLSTRTRIPNLQLTGQNIGLHGVLGVTMTALTTCAKLIDLDLLLEKIHAANGE